MIDSAHALTFRPASNETKKKYISLFSGGHSASSAHHHYEEDVLMDRGQQGIAVRSFNPDNQWVHRFYRKWRTQLLGSENGRSLSERLNEEVSNYNTLYNDSGGCAKMQWYEPAEEESNDDTDDCDEITEEPKTKRKRRHNCKETSKPFILALCTPLMARVHSNVVQSSEMVFCDSTASLDRLNTSLFIFQHHILLDVYL